MKTKVISSMVVGVFLSLPLLSQGNAQFKKRTMLWGGWQEQILIKDRWKISADVQGRYDLGNKSWYQELGRVGIIYLSPKKFSYSAGGAFFLLYPNPDTKPPRHEIRGWEEAGYKTTFHNTGIDLRIRTEQRFITPYVGREISDRYDFNAVRLRLRSDFLFPFVKTNSKLALYFSQESFFAFTSLHYSKFDQQRISAGLQYGAGHGFTLQATYVLQIQQTAKSVYDVDHIIRFSIIHSFSLIHGKS